MSIFGTRNSAATEQLGESIATALETTRQAFASLDFSSQNEELAQIDQEIARATAAIEQTRSRIAELGETDRSNDAGRAVAEAILGGRPPDDAAQLTTAAGERAERKAALLAAMPALVDTRRAAMERRNDILADAKRAAGQACAPLIDAIQSEAQDAAATLRRCYADIAALNAATDGGNAAFREQREVVTAISRSGIVPRVAAIPVSSGVRSLSEQLRGKGEAFPLKHGIAAEIGVP